MKYSLNCSTTETTDTEVEVYLKSDSQADRYQVVIENDESQECLEASTSRSISLQKQIPMFVFILICPYIVSYSTEKRDGQQNTEQENDLQGITMRKKRRKKHHRNC